MGQEKRVTGQRGWRRDWDPDLRLLPFVVVVACVVKVGRKSGGLHAINGWRRQCFLSFEYFHS